MTRTDHYSTHKLQATRQCGFLRISRYLRHISGRGLLNRNEIVFQGEEGATLVEMALATTILFALLFGVFEISLASYTYHYISDAAREGARWAMVRGSNCYQDMPWAPSSFKCGATTDQISDYVKSLGYPGIDSRNMTVTTTWHAAHHVTTSDPPSTTWDSDDCGDTDPCKVPGNEVQVTVTYNFPLSIPFWKSETIPISSTSTMVISQ